MPEWTLALADQQGNAVCELHKARVRRLLFTRNVAAEVGGTLDLDDDAASKLVALLANGIPRLRAYQDGVLRFYGKWQPMREQANVDGAEDGLQFLFRDPRAVLASRHTAAEQVYTATDQGEIGWDLIATTNAESPTGLARGTIEATVLRDRTYERKAIGEALTDLSGVIDGFDFDVTPTVDDGPHVLGLFNVYAQQGSDVTTRAIFEYGPETTENTLGVARAWQLPVNRAIVLGENGMEGVAEDAASIAKYDLWEKVVSANDGTTEQATLDAKAAELLRPNPIRVVEITPDPDLSPQPWKDYWLGDTVEGRAREGSLAFVEQVRVNSLEIALDDDGNETAHTLTFEQEGGLDG